MISLIIKNRFIKNLDGKDILKKGVYFVSFQTSKGKKVEKLIIK
ncbi:hypothetical protein JCM19314_1499 [Nonlabens ulvanivorans]|uniref:Secretion system C-terminal sorting domain-containing protein n=1 Tax=Nonlabens ulvanivorans TaxID=906888 RepID=A0A090QIZ0_NONUL|nr:hypothetical protein JCM19314_1499 [Nonlabens ulvanivorans]